METTIKLKLPLSHFDYLLQSTNNNYVEGVQQGHIFTLFDEEGNPKSKPCMCKDYFQDYFWACHTNKEVVQQYGYSCKPEPISNYYYLSVMYACNRRRGFDENHKYTNNISIPKEWIKSLKKFLKLLSKDLKLPCPIVTEHVSNKMFIVKFRKNWTQFPYLVSLLTYCIRIGCYTDYEEYLSTDYDTTTALTILNPDNYSNWNIVKNKILFLKENGLQKIKWQEYKTQDRTHNYSGIVSVNFGK